MLTSISKKRLAVGLLAAATLGTSLTGGSANADPKQFTAAVGVGSDTIQDVMNALSGNVNGVPFTPITSSSASGNRQIISFDATVPAGGADSCITTRLGGPTFTRPNGSSAGRRALNASNVAGNKWTGSAIGTTAICASLVDITGQIDFARSSSGPASGDTGTAMTYIPFGRDGVSFAYYRAAGSPVTSLTRAQLTSLFTTGPQNIGGVDIIPCGIQVGSGTYDFWNRVTTADATTEATGTAVCNALGTGLRLQENDGTALKAKGDAAPLGSQVIVGFSAASFIATSNLVAPGAPPAGVGLGSIGNNGSGVNLGSPTVGAAPTFTPNSAFYSDSVFGRNVYNVLPTAVATGPGNASMKTLFVGPTSAVCNSTATINSFGFLASGICGDTGIKGSWLVGPS